MFCVAVVCSKFWRTKYAEILGVNRSVLYIFSRFSGQLASLPRSPIQRQCFLLPLSVTKDNAFMPSLELDTNLRSFSFQGHFKWTRH